MALFSPDPVRAVGISERVNIAGWLFWRSASELKMNVPLLLNAFIDEKLVRFTSPPSLKRCDASDDIHENSSLASNCPFAPSVGRPEFPPKSSCVTATVVSPKLDVTFTRPSGSARYGFAELRLRE